LEFDTLLITSQVEVPYPGVYPGSCKKAQKIIAVFASDLTHCRKLVLNRMKKNLLVWPGLRKEKGNREPCNLCVREMPMEYQLVSDKYQTQQRECP
jgi:hypothetical protein